MHKFVCPDCGQSWVVPVLVKRSGTRIWFCDDCEAMWFGAEQPTRGPDYDLSTYMDEQGLRSFTEFEFLPVV